MNPSVSRISHHSRMFLFDSIHFRLGPRWGTRYSEGNSEGTRCVPTIHSTDESLNPQPEKLKHSKFNTFEDLAAFSQRFDEGIKKVFSSSNNNADQYVKFRTMRDNDLNYGIKAGRLTLTG